jgi:hypothetical protein
MAAVAIPLIAAALPEVLNLVNLIVGLVHPKAIAAEQAHGPLSGPVKFADVFVAVMADLVKAHAAGTIAILPDEATVKIIEQSVITTMKLAGMLGDAAAVVASPGSASAGGVSQAVKMTPGMSLLVTA